MPNYHWDKFISHHTKRECCKNLGLHEGYLPEYLPFCRTASGQFALKSLLLTLYNRDISSAKHFSPPPQLPLGFAQLLYGTAVSSLQTAWILIHPPPPLFLSMGHKAPNNILATMSTGMPYALPYRGKFSHGGNFRCFHGWSNYSENKTANV